MTEVPEFYSAFAQKTRGSNREERIVEFKKRLQKVVDDSVNDESIYRAMFSSVHSSALDTLESGTLEDLLDTLSADRFMDINVGPNEILSVKRNPGLYDANVILIAEILMILGAENV